MQRLATQRRGQNITRAGQLTASQDRRLDRQSREQIATLNRQAKADEKRRGRPEPADSRKARNSIVSIVADIKGDPKFRGRPPEATLALLRKRGANPLEARAAYEIHRAGGVADNTARMLRQAGIRVPRGWKIRT